MSSAKNDTAPVDDRPGRTVQRLLHGMPEGDRSPFLAYMVQAAGRASDTEILDAIRDYRLLVRGKPYLRIVSKGE